MALVRVTSKGQATIPKELRERAGISAPGRVIVREERGRIIVEPALTPAGFTKKWSARARKGPPPKQILREMDAADRRRERRLQRGRRGG